MTTFPDGKAEHDLEPGNGGSLSSGDKMEACFF